LEAIPRESAAELRKIMFDQCQQVMQRLIIEATPTAPVAPIPAPAAPEPDRALADSEELRRNRRGRDTVAPPPAETQPDPNVGLRPLAPGTGTTGPRRQRLLRAHHFFGSCMNRRNARCVYLDTRSPIVGIGDQGETT
jgi:hypothetical protein